MAALQHKVKEHDDRIRTLEINYEEFRSSNTREHEDFAKGISHNRTGNSQNGSEIKSIWDELKRCVSACQNIPAALPVNLVAQITSNADSIVGLKERADEMDDWKPRMIDLEKLTAELNANTTDLRVSTD